MPFGNRKKYFRGFFSSVSLQYKKYHPSGNLIFNLFWHFQSLKLRILMEKILSISLKLNFTPNTSGCYGLIHFFKKTKLVNRRTVSPVGHIQHQQNSEGAH